MKIQIERAQKPDYIENVITQTNGRTQKEEINCPHTLCKIRESDAPRAK